jgi:hypothetical protein
VIGGDVVEYGNIKVLSLLQWKLIMGKIEKWMFIDYLIKIGTFL